jgi:hypothetical protein
MPMAEWTKDEITRIGRAEEVGIAPLRRDGTLRKRVTIWAVPHDDGIYIRSVRGRNGAWYRGVQETHQGRIWAGGTEKDVTFVEVDHQIDDAIDAAYGSKYRRYAGRILDSILTPEACSTTLKVAPR